MEQYPYATVAFSGGTASALLVCALYESHGKSAPVLTANTPFFTQEEIYRVHEVLDDYPKMHSERVSMPDLLEIQEIGEAWAENRCAACALEISKRLMCVAKGLGANVLFDGKTIDACGCGILSGDTQGIQGISPFVELGCTRQSVEEMLRAIGRAYYIRPTNDCLACRLVADTKIDVQMLDFVEEAEKYIRRYTRNGMRVYIDKNKAAVFAQDILDEAWKKVISRELLARDKKITEVLIQDGHKSFWKDENR